MVDSAAFLSITGEILLQYAVAIGYLHISRLQEVYQQWMNAIILAVHRSSAWSTTADPVCIYLQAIMESVELGMVHIAPSATAFSSDPLALGYEERGIWHIKPTTAFQLARDYSAQHQHNFKLNQKNIHVALAELGLICTSQDSRQQNYTYRESFGTRPRLLLLQIEKARTYLNTKCIPSYSPTYS